MKENVLPTRSGAVLLLLCVIVAATACAEAARVPRLVILYATCTVNRDYLSPYNTSIPFTPNLERFARRSMVFTKHFSEAGQSGIAFASIFTGNQAYRHGIYRHPTPLGPDQYLISEAFSDAGYESFFWGHHPMADAALGYGQGVVPENQSKRLLTAEDRRYQGILTRLRVDPSYRAFLLTNFTMTHGPYSLGHLDAFLAAHPEQRGELTRAEISRYHAIYVDNRLQLQFNFPETIERLGLSRWDISKLAAVVELAYKSRIHVLDLHFGMLVDAIEREGLLDESLIVFTADHGEVLYREHVPIKWEHGNVLLPDTLAVPLFIRAPGLRPGGRWPAVTRSIDVMPTMLGLAGAPIGEHRRAEIEGVDLSTAMRGKALPPKLLAFSHTTLPVLSLLERRKTMTLLASLFPQVDEGTQILWTSVLDGDSFYRWRHVPGGGWAFEAFDLSRDPWAAVNVFDENNPDHQAMAERLRAYKQRLADGYSAAETAPQPDDIERLRSLGYVE